MRLLKLRASFGKLRSELELKEGFNELYLPNEAGKSTWSAFLVAMLYGIDTSERASAQNQGLPMKERYKPWDGRAMEGAIELLWQGRHITIERSAAGRVPMGNFRAYETESGIPVVELTGENCGRVLCGVERSVFERSAFIRQLGLAVTQDAALEKRLGALVATGEENGKTCLELEKELKNRRNKLIGRAGRIPRSTAEKDSLDRSRRELCRLQEEAMGLSAQRETAEKELLEAQSLLARMEAARAAQKRAGLTELETRIAEQEQLFHRLEETAAQLPPKEELHSLQRQLDSRESALQTAKMEAAFFSTEVEKPRSVQGFDGLSAEGARQQARRDRQEYVRLSANSPKKLTLPLLLSLLLAAAGLGLCFVNLFVGLSVAAIGLLVLIYILILQAKSRAKGRENAHQAQLLLLRYGLTEIEALMPLAESYAAAVEQYEDARTQSEQTKAELLAQQQQAQSALDQLTARVCSFAPECRSATACREAILAAIHVHEQILSQQRELQSLKKQQQTLLLVLGSTEHNEVDTEALQLDEVKLRYEERIAAQKLNQLTSRLDQIKGAVSAMGDPVSMAAEAEQLQDQIDRDTRQLEAIDIALVALKEADDALRSRFSPQITAEAGQILSALTREKYPTVLLAPDLKLSVREEGGTVMRPAAAMSCGTADQMYLALRLAMCHQLLSEEVPLILDDALVNFDEDRAKAALELLKKEAENRQVILFTCRKFS